MRSGHNLLMDGAWKSHYHTRGMRTVPGQRLSARNKPGRRATNRSFIRQGIHKFLGKNTSIQKML